MHMQKNINSQQNVHTMSENLELDEAAGNYCYGRLCGRRWSCSGYRCWFSAVAHFTVCCLLATDNIQNMKSTVAISTYVEFLNLTAKNVSLYLSFKPNSTIIIIMYLLCNNI